MSLQNVLLGMEKLKSHHTAQYIDQVLHEMCIKWNIPEKILCIVTDNGNNMKIAINETFGNRKHLPCFAQLIKINLIAQNAINSTCFKDIVLKVKTVGILWRF